MSILFGGEGGGKSPDDTNHLTQPHGMGSNMACWFIGNMAYPMQSVKTRMRCLSSVAFIKSQNNFKILIVIYCLSKLTRDI